MIKANRNLNKLTLQFKQKVELFLEEANNIFITEGYRSTARQKELYNQGRTTPGKIVTWTLKSNHLKGTAIDIAFKGPKLYPTKLSVWKKVGVIAKKYGIDWGYDIWNGKDKPHFQDNGQRLLADNYRGVKLQLSSGRMGKEYNAFYDPKADIINIQALYFTITDEVKRDSVIFHEFCHHIFIKKVNWKYRELWKSIYSFNPIIIQKLNKFLGTKFIENAFITEYAKTNYLEGFSECMEQNYLIDKGVDKKQYKGFLKIKLYIAKLIYNKFVDLDYKIK